jgi:uncharacterized protein (DUF1501 family)
MTLPAFTRRQFLYQGLTLASASLAVPRFIQASALGLPHAALGMSSIPGVDQDRILVVIQLSGGNDGLNTLVPFGADEYYKLRPGIGIAADQTLKLGKSRAVGLHPQMAGIKGLYDDGLCSIIQGVGYPNPNRSHFKSMDIWHTADTSATGDGWLGRYFDAQCCGQGKGESGKPEATKRRGDGATKGPDSAHSATPGIAIGRTAPLAMEGGIIRPIAFESEDLFRWTGEDINSALKEPYRTLTRQEAAPDAATGRPESNADFLTRTALDAQVSSETIRRAVRKGPSTQFPGSQLAQQLAMVAAMIRAGLPTRVYYVSMGGFDTHAGQGGAQGSHGNLLSQFSEAVRAFYAELKATENADRVLTMSFSEFGRRVGQNNSNGTDHGTAAPMFLFGPMVKAGLLGTHPSLSDLDDGDLKYTTDFRSVYTGILDGWLKADAKKILEGNFRAMGVVR